jgi:hypothetical protein
MFATDVCRMLCHRFWAGYDKPLSGVDEISRMGDGSLPLLFIIKVMV